MEALSLIAGEGLAKEGIPKLLEAMAVRPDLSAAEAARAAGLLGVGQGEVEAVVAAIVADGKSSSGRGARRPWAL
jgi:glutamyl-tRNA(Gln) amidotransferase subunit E